MDKAKPHLPKKRPALTIDADAEPVAMTEARPAEPAIDAQAGDATADATPGASDVPMADQTGGPSLPDEPSAPSGDADPNETQAETGKTTMRDAASRTASEPGSAPNAATGKPRGGGSSLLGGLVGALAALAGGYGLQNAGYLPTPASGTDRIAALETRLAAMSTADDGDMQGEVAALKASVAALAQAAGDTSLATRLNELEQRLGTLSAAGNAANAADPLILERLAAVESRLDAPAQPNTALDELRTGLNAEIAGLRADIEALAARLEAQGSAPDLAAAVAATALRAAVDRGGPFAGELETLATLQPDSQAVAALRGFAAAGVPPRTALLSEFEAAASAMLAAAEPVNPDAGFIERMAESARSLVRVRPVGDIEGDTPGARIARMGEALTRSDDAAVEAEFAALPAPSRAAGDVFMARFRARAEADRLITEAVRAAAGAGN
ncbi:MAG: hypothetical protein MUC58_00685 [Rhizobiaceae bacterium]|nr:hypothetical protein [Rhizobiaceae bacterium]